MVVARRVGPDRRDRRRPGYRAGVAMRIENCVIITSKDSRIEMTAEELRYFFAGNRVVDHDALATALPAGAPFPLAPSGDEDPAAAEPGHGGPVAEPG